jgi:imidazolonepropionase-like amidohydrolase
VPTATPLPIFDLVLRGATLIDGTGAPPQPDTAVAIRDGRIAWTGRSADLVAAPGTPERELAGATVLPGIINAHAHTYELAVDELRAWTHAGVTTLRDLGGPRDVILQRGNELAASDDPLLPRLLVAGPILTVPGGYPISIDGPDDRSLAVSDAQAAVEQTNRLLDQGAAVIKIAVSGRSDVAWP